jgi:hypothetical protein
MYKWNIYEKIKEKDEEGRYFFYSFIRKKWYD